MPGKYFYIFVLNIYVCLAEKPTLTPANQVVVQENELLRFGCIGENDLMFLYPDILKKNISSSPVEFDTAGDKTTRLATFIRKHVVYGDTGWYGCISTTLKNHTAKKLQNIYLTPYNYKNDSDVEWTYVFVESKENPFVESKGKVKNLRDPSKNLDFDEYLKIQDLFSGRPGEPIFIPYRPTSPTLNVTLLKDDQKVQFDDRIKFDPKLGIVFKNATIEDSGMYLCLANDSFSIEFHLLVTESTLSLVPKIYYFLREYNKYEKKLEMECSIAISKDIYYELIWKTPQESDRISTFVNTTNIGKGHFLLNTKNKLIVENFSSEDEGEYECQLYKDSEVYTSVINVKLTEDDDVIFENVDTFKYIKYENSTTSAPEKRVDYEKLIHAEVEKYIHDNIDPQLNWLQSFKSNVRNLLQLFLQ